MKNIWLVPAACGTLFLLFSLLVVLQSGWQGLSSLATSNLWGPQVLIDLCIALGAGLILLAPRARLAGLRLGPWVLATLFTGSIGFAFFIARLLFVEQRRA